MLNKFISVSPIVLVRNVDVIMSLPTNWCDLLHAPNRLSDILSIADESRNFCSCCCSLGRRTWKFAHLFAIAGLRSNVRCTSHTRIGYLISFSYVSTSSGRELHRCTTSLVSRHGSWYTTNENQKTIPRSRHHSNFRSLYMRNRVRTWFSWETAIV